METIYTYDDNGSLKTRRTGDKSITYHWENDGENRLKGVDIVEGGLTTEIDYEYNEQGIRVGKKVNDVETNYLIDELQPYAQVLEEYDALGELQAAYTYGEDLISRVEGGETSFYHVDGLGSTRVLTDESGNIEESYNYDAYGNLITGNSVENAYLFAGEQRDIETGLDYLRARYYDPALGRFISRDAYSGNLNDPVSLHKYQYAHANPVVNTDPSGYLTLKELLTGLAIGSTLSSFSFTTGAAVGTLANGGSVADAGALYDQFFAGYSDSLTFGGSTLARRLRYGERATRNHQGIFFGLGRISGALTSAWVGSFGATALARFSSAPWWARAALGYDLFGAGVGIVQSTINIMTGRATAWDLLSFLPLFSALPNNIDDIVDPQIGGLPRSGKRLVLNQNDLAKYGDVACGPTSCAMALDTLGLPYDLDKLVLQTRIAKNEGALPHTISVALKSNGVNVARSARGMSIDSLKRATSHGHPAITVLKLGDDTFHYVVVDGITKRQGQRVVAIRDPGSGTQYFSPVEKFSKLFYSEEYNGVAILTNPRN